MAFNFNLTGDQNSDAPGAEESVGVVDLGKKAVADTLSTAAGVPSAAQLAGERSGNYNAAKVGEGAGIILRSLAEKVRGSMSAGAKDAEANPTRHPAGWLALQAAGFAPQAAIIMAVPESLLAQVAAGGAMQAGTNISDVFAKTSDLSTEALAKESPVFAELLNSGLDPYMARVRLRQMQMDNADLITSFLAGGAGTVGLSNVVKGASQAGKGLVRGALGGVAEAAPGGALQGGQAAYASENADVVMGAKPEVDMGAIGAEAVKGAAGGAALGGAIGGVTGLSGRKPAGAPAAPRAEASPDPVPAQVSPKPSEEAVVQAAVTPTPTPAAPTPAAPTPAAPVAPPAAPPAVGPKGAAVKAKAKKKLEVTAGPTEAETTALVVNQPEAKPQNVDPTADLLKKAQEINQRAAEQPAPVAPEAVPPQVSPDIAQKAAALPRPDPSLAPEPGAGPRGEAWLQRQAAERAAPAPAPMEPQAAVATPPKVELPAPEQVPSAAPVPEEAPRLKRYGRLVETPAEPDTTIPARVYVPETAPDGQSRVFRDDTVANRMQQEAVAAVEARATAEPQAAPDVMKVDAEASPKEQREAFKRRARAYQKQNPGEQSIYSQALGLMKQRDALGRGKSPAAAKLDEQIRALMQVEQEAIARGDIQPPARDKGGNRKEVKPEGPKSERGQKVVEGRKRAAEARAAMEKKALDEAERLKAIDVLAKQQKKDDETARVSGAFGTKGLERNADQHAYDAIADGEDVHTAMAEAHEDAPTGTRIDDAATETVSGQKGEKAAGSNIAQIMRDFIEGKPPEPMQEAPSTDAWKPKLKEGEGYETFTAKEKPPTEKRRIVAPERKKLSPAEVQAKIKERAAALRREQEAKATQKVTEELAHDEVPGPADALKRIDAASVKAHLGDERPARRAVFAGMNGERITPIHSSNLASALQAIKPEGVNRLIQRKLHDLVGDVPFHVLTQEGMGALDGSEHGSRGMWTRPSTDADSAGHVVVRADQFSHPDELSHTVLHEAAHAAIQRAMEKDPNLTRVVKDLMLEVHAAHGDVVFLEYGFRDANPHEFMAEAFSNPQFQNLLQRTPVSSRMSARLGLDRRVVHTLWDMIVRLVRGAAKLPEGVHSALEAAIRVGEEATSKRKTLRGLDPADVIRHPDAVVSRLIDSPVDRATALVKDMADQPGAGVTLKKWRNALSSFSDMAAYAEKHFGVGKPIQRIADFVEMRRIKAQRLIKADEPLVNDLYKAQRQFAGEKWDGFTKLLVDATTFQVHPDRPLDQNTHLGKESLAGVQGKAVHADLAQAYSQLPPELKALYKRMFDYGATRQLEMKDMLVENILRAAGHDDPALIRRAQTVKKLDEADQKALGEVLTDAIKGAKELTRIEGPYFPLMRRGDFAVRGEMAVPKPAQPHTAVDANTFQFKSKDDATAYVSSVKDMHVELTSMWVDPTTGERTTKDAHTQQGSPVQVFQARVQNQHVEFVDSFKEARDRTAELERAGLTMKAPVPREVTPGVINPDLTSGQLKTLKRSLAHRTAYKDMSAGQKKILEEALHEASLKVLAGTRVATRHIQRTNVQGASRDWVRNFHDYSVSTGGYMAKLEFAPQIGKVMEEAKAHAKAYEHDKNAADRQQILTDVEARVAGQNAEAEGGAVSAGIRRVKTLSFLDKLVSPAFNIINSTQPVMVTMPVLAGRHGVGRGFAALTQAYRDLGASSTVVAGLRDTARAITDQHAQGTNFLDTYKSRLKNPNERAMLDYLAERGLIDPEAGMEIAKLVAAKEGAWGKVDAGLARAENIGRMLPSAIEAMNRTVTALSAYRLERDRGASHQAAMEYAQRVVTDTQGNYSHTNAPRIFNHPLMGLSLQFKKFGQMMYSLLGRQIGQALKGATREERVQAWKTLAYLGATHVGMAGTLGLPTEPFKFLLVGAQAAGLTDIGWDDVERWERQKAAEHFGPVGGELLTRGLSRVSGADFSSRVGMDSFLSFGSPRSNKENDWKAYLFDTIGGAPTAFVGDMIKGANQAMDGNFQEAAELMVPLKVVADALKARRLYSEGKLSPDGRVTMEPYSAGEAAMRTMGFTPRREAERSAQRSAVGAMNNKVNEQRAKLMAEWQKAAPSGKAAAFKQIQKWNESRTADQKITMAQLTAAAKRNASAEQRGHVVAGVRVVRNADEARRIAGAYNAGQ